MACWQCKAQEKKEVEKGEKTATHPHTNKRANNTTQQQTTWKEKRKENIVPISDQRTDEQTARQWEIKHRYKHIRL